MSDLEYIFALASDEAFTPLTVGMLYAGCIVETPVILLTTFKICNN